MKKIKLNENTDRFKIAILLITYNRIEPVKLVLNSIKKIKPTRIYIASDGPKDNDIDAEKVNLVRKFVLDDIDWNCEVKTLFHSKNKSSKYGPISAIDWFFENEEEGIILEDDCVPSLSFYKFCEILLDRYKYNKKVWHVAGVNFQNDVIRGNADYYFSKYAQIWGWATWRDRWKYYNIELDNIDNELFIKNSLSNKLAIKYWNKTLSNIKNGLTSTWAAQWVLTVLFNNGLCAIPNINMVRNVGFGTEATNTQKENNYLIDNEEKDIRFPLLHPQEIIINHEADNYIELVVYKISNIFQKIYFKLLRIIFNKRIV